MAIAQPLTAFSNRIDDNTLKGVDTQAPLIRKVHKTLDGCAKESGPQRFETARRAAPADGDGAFYLMGAAPSPALRALFDAAEGARDRFNDQLSVSADLMAPIGVLRILDARPAPCEPRAPMDTFLRMLESDEATSPSSLEGLFEDLEEAQGEGLISMDAGGLALTEKGRAMIDSAGPALNPVNDAAMGRVDLYAQEVADGRLSLAEAIQALGHDLEMPLPAPGQPDEVEAPTLPSDAGVRIDTTLFDPLLLAVLPIPIKDRTAVATAALHQRLEDWGLSTQAAQSILRHDIRCLRALSSSVSHGPIDLRFAQAAVVQGKLQPFVDVAAHAVGDTLLEALTGPKRALPEPDTAEEPGADGLEATAPRMGFCRRLLFVFLGRP
jgi:hypothetical protein